MFFFSRDNAPVGQRERVEEQVENTPEKEQEQRVYLCVPFFAISIDMDPSSTTITLKFILLNISIIVSSIPASSLTKLIHRAFFLRTQFSL
jgi:hypothetical protein